jgi:hypothetical protein
MSDYWVPSGTYVSVENTSAFPVVASNQATGLFRFYNIGESTAIVAVVSVSATGGEASYTPIAPNGILYVAFGQPIRKILVSNSTCFVNPGYMLK